MGRWSQVSHWLVLVLDALQLVLGYALEPPLALVVKSARAVLLVVLLSLGRLSGATFSLSLLGGALRSGSRCLLLEPLLVVSLALVSESLVELVESWSSFQRNHEHMAWLLFVLDDASPQLVEREVTELEERKDSPRCLEVGLV